MRSYTLYRITATIQFVLFFFITILAFDWAVDPILVLVLTFMNDATTIALSVDRTLISMQPDKWQIGQISLLAVCMGGLLAGEALAFFLVARYAFDVPDDELEGIMYLHLSMAANFIILSTRLPAPMYKQAPSWQLAIAIILAQIGAFTIAKTGALSDSMYVVASSLLLRCICCFT